MVFEEILALIAPFIAIVITILSIFLITLINTQKQKLKESIENEKIKQYIDLVADSALIVVTSLNQTLVDNLKNASADGKLTTDEMTYIKNIALDKIHANITEEAKHMIETVIPDLESWLSDLIESYVYQLHSSELKISSDDDGIKG